MRAHPFYLLLLLATACGTPARTPAADDRALLLDGQWDVATIDGRAVDANAPTAYLTLASGDERRAYGYSGCNRFSGSYLLDGDRLSFSQMMMTRRACLGHNVERAFSDVLARTTRFRLANGRLVLMEGDNEIAVLQRNETKE
jgi:heat shock protein HslJ